MKHYRIFLLLTSLLLLSGIACKQPTVTNSTSTYSIYFNPNGGTGTMSPVTESSNTQIRLPECTFTNGDLVFSGWATSAKGTVIHSDRQLPLIQTSRFTLFGKSRISRFRPEP